MQKSLLKLLLVVIGLTLSAAVQALGMGGINVGSALGQPLQADIELVSVSKAERDSLVVRLAQASAYKSAGLEYPHGNKFKFQIESRADGRPYLQVTSEQPINDPFVSLLVELTWPSGRLLREYTFLLDPPGYVSEQPVQSNVQVVEPSVQAEQAAEAVVAGAGAAHEGVSPVESAVTSREQTAPADIEVDQEVASTETAAVSEAPVETVATPSEPVAPKANPTMAEPRAPAVDVAAKIPEWVAVPRGSTMYKLAEQYKPVDASVERMLVALYRANTDKFDDRNMNRIKAGKILRVPQEEELSSVTQVEAEKEIRVQAADWNAYRQKLASAAPVSSQPQAAQQVAVGKISSSVVDRTPVAKESAKEVLKLSKGEAPGDQAKAVGSKGMSEQDKKNAVQEEAIAKAKALEEDKARAVLLEKNLKDMQRLAQLKSEAAALAAKSSGTPAVNQDAAPAAASGVEVASAVNPKPKVPEPKVKAKEPEQTLVDQILAEPLYLAGGALVLLALGGLGFKLTRRKNESKFTKGGDASEDVGSITSRIAAPVVPSPETGDFTRSVESSELPAAGTQSGQEPDSVDPISEADLFLSFGRDGQAEEILKDALKSTPGNHQIHLKLLGIYANRQDVNAFGTIARELKDSGDEGLWQQAAEMGRKLDPDNPLYGGAGSMEDTSTATVQMAAFDVSKPPVSVGASIAQPSALDFNLGESQEADIPVPERDFMSDMEKTTVLSSPGVVAEQVSAMDFDVTSTNQSTVGLTDAALPKSDDLIFDVTGGDLVPAAQPAISEPAGDSGGMEFTLDFPVEKTAEESAPEPLGADLAGINLNFDEASTPREASSEARSENWQEVATKLDLAKAYQEMGDAGGAREILDEVMREGDEEQRQAAQNLLAQLG